MKGYVMIIVYFFLGIIGFFLLLSLLTARYRNKYKLYMVFGKKGSGKSTFLIKQAIRYMKRGYTVYTNMSEINLDGVRLIDINSLGEFVPVADSLLILDEIGMVWDNRAYKDFKPAVRDFFKLQRHYHVVCYLASQTFDIDKKLRDLTDAMYLCVCCFNVFSVAKRIYRKIVLTESSSEAESRIAENLKFAAFWNWCYTFIPKYAKYFDSFVVPPKAELRYRLIQSENRIKVKGRRKKTAIQQLHELDKSSVED